MTSELKPCPFCGSSAEITEYHKDNFDVSCSTEGCGVRPRTTLTDMETAIADWNTRAVPDVPELVRYNPNLNHQQLNDMVKTTDGKYVRHDQAVAVIAKREQERDNWKAQAQQATSVISMIRAMVGEMFGTVANIESEEATLLRGSESKHDGEAILAALQNIAAVITAKDAEVDNWKFLFYQESASKKKIMERVDIDPYHELNKMQRRAEAAEAKLAKINDQKPVAYRYRTTDVYGNPHINWSYKDTASLLGLPEEPLYAAPVASDADLRAKLSDPTAILINMMRGEIAKPEFDSLQRIYPEIADLRAETIEQCRKAVRNAILRMTPEHRANGDICDDVIAHALAALNPSEPRI